MPRERPTTFFILPSGGRNAAPPRGVHPPPSAVVRELRAELASAEATLSQAQHDLIIETKFKETNWRNLESATKESKRAANSLQEEQNIVRTITRRNDVLKQEMLQQKLDLAKPAIKAGFFMGS